MKRAVIAAMFILTFSGCSDGVPEPSAHESAASPPLARKVAQAAPSGRGGEQAEEVGDTSAKGAAEVLNDYYALIEGGRYEEAWRLRWPDPAGPSPADFAASFRDYRDYRATVGRPSDIAGAAGSLYVEVPVQIYGTKRDGTPIGSAGTVTLRRANGDGQAHGWRIYAG